MNKKDKLSKPPEEGFGDVLHRTIKTGALAAAATLAATHGGSVAAAATAGLVSNATEFFDVYCASPLKRNLEKWNKEVYEAITRLEEQENISQSYLSSDAFVVNLLKT